MPRVRSRSATAQLCAEAAAGAKRANAKTAARVLISIMTEQLLAVLREGYEGPAHTISYFLDGGPDAGLRNTLAALTAGEASRAWAGNSVAAHVQHILFSFSAFGAYIAGDRVQRDWNESWTVTTVDDAAWKTLQGELSAAYEELAATIAANTGKGATRGAVAAVTHFAYHIGAIRQKLAAAREPSS